MVNPRRRVLERIGIEVAGARLSFTATRNEPRPLENFQMFRDGGHGHVERARQFRNGRVAGGEPRENGAPGGISQGGEGQTQSIGGNGI